MKERETKEGKNLRKQIVGTKKAKKMEQKSKIKKGLKNGTKRQK